MYWKRQRDYEYQVKTQPDGRQRRVGPRSLETERASEEFSGRKRSLEDRLRSLRSAVLDADRLNKASKVGRVPSPVLAVLQAIEDASLGEQMTGQWAREPEVTQW